jgi:hypothetical protein
VEADGGVASRPVTERQVRQRTPIRRWQDARVSATVFSVSSRATIDACARLGLGTTRILAAPGLDRTAIEDPETRIPIEQMQAR